MSLPYKLLALLIVLAGTFVGGFFLGKGKKEVTTITKQGEKEVVYKDRIVTKIIEKKPDGTIIEKTVTEDKSGKTTEKQVDKSTQVKSALAKYSLGLGIERIVTTESIGKTFREYTESYYGSVGVRVWGPAWAELQYQPRTNELRLGLRVEL